MKLKGAELLLLLLLLSRSRRYTPPAQIGPGEWEPGPDNLGVTPLPPNPLQGGN